MPPTSIARVDWGENVVHVSMTRDEIKRSPSMEEAEVPSYEMTPPFVII